MTFRKLIGYGLLMVAALLVVSGCSSAATKVPATPAATSSTTTSQAAKPAAQPATPPPGAHAPVASTPVEAKSNPSGSNIKLPDPRFKSTVSLEEALQSRRSIRSYADAPLSPNDVSQLLWAAQGITSSTGQRTAPSAMAIYTIDVYIVVNNVEGLDKGIYLYVPAEHSLARVKDGSGASDISSAYRGGAPVSIILAGEFDKISARSGAGKEKWVYMEGGHVAENICLQATALNLGTVTMGGFTEDKIKSVLGITGNTGIIYVMPVGKKTG